MKFNIQMINVEKNANSNWREIQISLEFEIEFVEPKFH